MAGVDPETLEQAWREVESHWEDDPCHRRFLELSRLAGDLRGAGTRYRTVRETRPERAAMAAAQIDRLLNLALKDMQALRSPPRARSRVGLWLVLSVIGAALVILARTLLAMR